MVHEANNCVLQNLIQHIADKIQKDVTNTHSRHSQPQQQIIHTNGVLRFQFRLINLFQGIFKIPTTSFCCMN